MFASLFFLLNLHTWAGPQDLKPWFRPTASAVISNPQAPTVPVPAPSYKTYREWKNDQIALWKSKGQSEMANDLTVADYFAGYITKQKDRSQAIKDVAPRLNADEVADLMTIYANSVFGTQSPQLPQAAENQVRK